MHACAPSIVLDIIIHWHCRRGRVLYCIAMLVYTLQCIAVYCNILQCTVSCFDRTCYLTVLVHSYTHTLIHSYTHTLIHVYTHTRIQAHTTIGCMMKMIRIMRMSMHQSPYKRTTGTSSIHLLYIISYTSPVSYIILHPSRLTSL